MQRQLNSLAEIKFCSRGDTALVCALIGDIKVMQTSEGRDYVRVYLRDQTGTTSVPLWNDTLEKVQEIFKIGEVYSFTLVMGEFNGSVTVKRISNAVECTDEKILKQCKQYMYKHATDMCIQLVLAAVKQLLSTPYGPYIQAIYGNGTNEDDRFKELLKAFASVGHHDNYSGGFINHIGGMLHIASFVKSQYLAGRCEEMWTADWMYITAAILMHDIGKLEIYVPIADGLVRYREDCMLDHNICGTGELYAIHASLPEEKRLPSDLFYRLAYSIGNHDKLESLYAHKHVEDRILSNIDGLDAALASCCVLKI